MNRQEAKVLSIAVDNLVIGRREVSTACGSGRVNGSKNPPAIAGGTDFAFLGTFIAYLRYDPTGSPHVSVTRP